MNRRRDTRPGNRCWVERKGDGGSGTWNVERGKDLGIESFRILEPRQDEDTCEGGNDGGRSTVEFEEMEFFTLPPP